MRVLFLIAALLFSGAIAEDPNAQPPPRQVYETVIVPEAFMKHHHQKFKELLRNTPDYNTTFCSSPPTDPNRLAYFTNPVPEVYFRSRVISCHSGYSARLYFLNKVPDAEKIQIYCKDAISIVRSTIDAIQIDVAPHTYKNEFFGYGVVGSDPVTYVAIARSYWSEVYNSDKLDWGIVLGKELDGCPPTWEWANSTAILGR
ncbi:hypothetical protein ABW19_dt0207656 [Dactylella cylindrospora]|nr:hypothetical protein ABW19_dt0207656 [Dactylella cylindrospora]